jgi:hypothetical protein
MVIMGEDAVRLLGEKLDKNTEVIHRIDKEVTRLCEHVANQNGRVAKNELAVEAVKKDLHKMRWSLVRWILLATGAGQAFDYLLPLIKAF